MIGTNIRKIRQQKKLTQEKLARPNIKTVVKIAKALNVSLDKLVENYI